MKIGILQTGHAPDALADMGTYPEMFERLLAGHGFTFETWPVVDNVFPASVTDADGWLITGSRHGAYDDLPWIAPLERFVRDAFDAERPVVGVCFGHQIIAQALGGKVEKFAGGWAVGRTRYDFPDGSLPLNAWHQDQVTVVPEGAEVIAGNDFCANAAMVYGDKAFTVQPHPEYGDDFIAGLIATRGRGVVPDALLDNALANAGQPLANHEMAARMAHFFKHKRLP